MNILERLLKDLKDNSSAFLLNSDSGLHSNQRIMGTDGELDSDPDADVIDKINRKNVSGGTDKNKKDFERQVYNKDDAGDKPEV